MTARRRLVSCASTNAEAARWLAEGAAAFSTVVADAQTGGRGRRGRNWFSPAGQGLWVSFVLRPRLAPERAPLIALAGAVAAASALAEVGVSGVRLKWPNDLLLGSRKLGGVLAELHGTPDASGRLGVVLGVGVNLAVPAGGFPAEIAATATSVLAERGVAPDRDAVLDALARGIRRWVGVMEQRGPGPLIEAFGAALAGMGEEVEVALPAGPVRGVAAGIGPGGELLLRGRDGSVTRVLAGDVRLVEGHRQGAEDPLPIGRGEAGGRITPVAETGEGAVEDEIGHGHGKSAGSDRN